MLRPHLFTAHFLACLFLAFSFSALASDEEGRRVLALVIGNSEYQGISSLTNAGRDAQLISSTLAEIGVDSAITRFDLTRAEMSRTVNEFFGAMSRYDVGFVYYAGHGMQDEYGENYLVPVDFGTEPSPDLYSEGFPTERIFRGCSRLRDKAFVFFLDACRNNPYPSDYRSSGSGLGEPEVPSEGVLVGFSTESGKVAGDYAEQSNGHYATALSEMLKVPNMKAEDILKEVGTIVRDRSDRKQSPEWWGNLSGSVIFNFDAAQYEVQLAELQEAIVSRIVGHFTAHNVPQLNAQYGHQLPVDLWDLGSRLRTYSQEHIKRGQRKLADRAEFCALLLDFHTYALHNTKYPDTRISVTYMHNVNEDILYNDNIDLMEAFGWNSPKELRLFIDYASLLLNTNVASTQDILQSFVNGLWSQDNTTWMIGTSWLSTLLSHMDCRNPEVLPRSYHLEIEGDTISYFSSAAHPGVELQIGMPVRAIITNNGDTISHVPKDLDGSLKFLIKDGGQEFVLTPNPGIVINDSEFVSTPSRREYLKHLRDYLEEGISVEIQEIWWIMGRDIDVDPAYMHLLPYRSHMHASYSWHYAVLNSDASSEIAETVWAMFTRDHSRLRWCLENDGKLGLALLYEAVWAFDFASNGLRLLPKAFCVDKGKEMKRELVSAADLIIGMHELVGFQSGELYVENLPNFIADEVTSFASIMWQLAAVMERVAFYKTSLSEDLLEASAKLVEEINHNSIDELSSIDAYQIAYLNYMMLLSARLRSQRETFPMENLTEVLRNMNFVFTPYKSESSTRLLDHNIISIDLLANNDALTIEEFFKQFSTWANLYAQGYYIPLQVSIVVLQSADMSDWSLHDKKKIFSALGPLAMNWHTSVSSYRLKENEAEVESIYNSRFKELTEVVEMLMGEQGLDTTWYSFLKFERENVSAVLDEAH